WGPDSTGVYVLLVPLQRSVPDLRPAPRIVAVATPCTDIIDLCKRVLELYRVAVFVGDGVGRTAWPPFLACTVVRHQHDEGVVSDTQVLQVRDQPFQLVVGVLEHSGEGLL